MGKRNLRQGYGHGSWWRRLWMNRRYKDALFRHLFRDKQDLLELYNALNGSTYTDPGELEVVTLEDVIFMKMKNDLSFIIGSSLNLYELKAPRTPICLSEAYSTLPNNLRDYSAPVGMIFTGRNTFNCPRRCISYSITAAVCRQTR